MTAPSAHPALRGRPIYLNYNSTTPLDPAVVEATTPYLTREFGNQGGQLRQKDVVRPPV